MTSRCKKLKGNIYIIILFVLILCTTYKYVAYPEPYTFETARSGGRIELGNNIIKQDIIIDENSNWDGKSYFAFYFNTDSKIEKGYVQVTLLQNNKILQSCRIEGQEIVSGFYSLDEMNYSVLSKGIASIEIQGVDLSGTVYLETIENKYNFPNCQINGKSIPDILVQKYHFYFLNYEFIFRVFAFFLFAILNAILLYFVLAKDEDKKLCFLAHIVLAVSYICLHFIYDSSLFLSPTWAESVTNFAHNAMNVGLRKNLLLTDAGYLPLLQRLITLFAFRILNIGPYYALYFMQICVYIISGYILSFFCKWQFRNCLSLKSRYLVSIICMIQIINNQTGSFINFIVYGIFIILLYFLADSKEWSRFEFIFLCFFGCIACLSKGAFVTIFPLMAAAVLLFYKRFSRRDLVFALFCFTGALLQLIYYMKQGISWFDRAGTANDPSYFLKLICSVLIDVPNSILSLFEGNISVFNGISLPIIFIFWFLIVYLLIRHVVLPLLKKNSLDRDYLVFFLYLLYIAGQGLFSRLTIYGVSTCDVGTDEFWSFTFRGNANRYLIYLYLAVICLLMVSIKLLKKRNLRSVERVAVMGFAFCVMIANPRFQLKGMGTDNYAANRNYLGTINAEIELMKDIEDAECRIVPIQPNGWSYKKNANLYCFGENVLGWGGTTTVPESAEGDFSHGSVDLLDFRTVDNTCGIWQVFVSRVSLINNKIYQVIVKDASGNVILQKEQDNTNYQNIVSFTFASEVPDAASIEIRDIDWNRVYIRNGIYVVTKADERIILAGK